MLFWTQLIWIQYAIGFVYAGIGPDYRVLVANARKSAQEYFLTYRELAPVSEIAQNAADVMQEYTQSGGVRPFGVSLLVAGYDHEGPQLFQVDPSGNYVYCVLCMVWLWVSNPVWSVGAYFGWKATAIGKNYGNAKNFLERRYKDDMELDDAIHVALLTMKESYEGEMTEHNIEVGVVSRESGGVFRVLSAQEVRDFLDEAL